MKSKWHILLAMSGLLFQPIPVIFIRVTAWMAYGGLSWLPEPAVWPFSMVGIALCGLISLALGVWGAYLLLTRSHLVTAIVLIILCCIPALMGASVYLRATLVFLTLV